MRNVQAKLQTFAGAIMVPIILLMLVGSFMGIDSAFMNYTLPEGNIPYNLLTMIANLGFTFMSNLQLWFAVVIAFTLAKKEGGWATFVGLILFFCFMRGIEGWATPGGWTAETTTTDALIKNGCIQQAALNLNTLWSSSLGVYSYNMGIFSGIVAGLITAGLHNGFVDTEPLAIFGFFAETKFIIIIAALVSTPLATVFYYVWLYAVGALQSITGFIRTSSLLETFVFGTLDKMLLPFGIHHLIVFPIEYTKVGGTIMIDGVTYEGVKNTISDQTANVSTTGYITRSFTNRRLLFQLVGLPDAAFAMYRCTKPENKRRVASLLIPSVFVLAMVGTSEPIECTFLFAAPTLH